MCDQLATVDLDRLTDPVGFLTIDEIYRVDEPLALILDLSAELPPVQENDSGRGYPPIPPEARGSPAARAVRGPNGSGRPSAAPRSRWSIEFALGAPTCQVAVEAACLRDAPHVVPDRGWMVERKEFTWDGIVKGKVTRRIRKGLKRLPSPARVDIARQAMTAIETDLPLGDELVARYYHYYFRAGRVVQEAGVSCGPYTTGRGEEVEIFDDPLNICQGDYFDVWDKTQSVEDFRRQQAVETLSWAVMIADGDNRSVNYPCVEQTIYHAVITLTYDAVRRDALLEKILAAVDSG